MSDFSLFSLFTAGLACMIPFTAAYTQPKGAEPKGNPFSQPGLNSVVPAGEKFTVTWQPTTQGTVTLVLLKGPSTNAEPLYPIVESIPNSGSYVWTPSTSLQPSDPSTPAQGYGIQLIVDSDGQYQYTTQFGISNANYQPGSSSSGSSSSASAPSYGGGYGSSSSSASAVSMSSKAGGYAHSATAHATSSAKAAHSPSNLPKPIGHSSKVHNITMVAPTYSVPKSTMMVSATQSSVSAQNTTTSAQPTYRGDASSMVAGLGSIVLAAGVAVFAL